MRHRIYVLGLCAVALLACDSANPVAPSGAVLSVSANPSQIGLNGQSTITVTGFKPDANRLNPGTQIIVSTSLGDLFHPTTGQPVSIVEIDGNGSATAILRGNGRAGMAMVTATLSTAGGGGGGGGNGMDGGGGSTSGSTTQSVTVQIGVAAEDQNQITVTASPSVVNLNGTATVTAIARNSDGTLFGAGGSVQIRTDLGTLDNSGNCDGGSANSVTVTTNANSEAVTTLCAGDQPGSATITATFGSSMEATATVTIENQRPVLIISANPTTIDIGEESTITVIARTTEGLPIQGQRVAFTTTLGRLSPDERNTDGNGEVRVELRAESEAGDAVVQAISGTSEPVMTTVTIRDAAASIRVNANPATIPAAGGVINLTALVRNAQGEGFGGAAVNFSALIRGGSRDGLNIGSLASQGGAVLTSSQGEATDSLTIEEDELTDPDTGDPIVDCVRVISEVGGVNGQVLDDFQDLPVGSRLCPSP